METWQRMFAQKMAWEKPRDKWSLTPEDNLSPRNLEPGWQLYQQGKAFARFECSGCSRRWPSAQVVLLFQMHLAQRQGRVKMRLFGQTCKKCWAARFEKPAFTQEAMERILDNLVQKILQKCYRESLAKPKFAEPLVEEEVEGPHDTARCEACALGVCSVKGSSARAPLAPASLHGRLAGRGADTESCWRLLCYVLPVLAALLGLAVHWSGQ
ncbi:receptor-transporting protein 3-like [Pelodiscus sinensis]|uniref:receptor-transporting protein 3-like n=1 Tax=Pelodiscus sinensis TaxID=13735 RepID=UPI003F6AC6E8